MSKTPKPGPTGTFHQNLGPASEDDQGELVGTIQLVRHIVTGEWLARMDLGKHCSFLLMDEAQVEHLAQALEETRQKLIQRKRGVHSRLGPG